MRPTTIHFASISSPSRSIRQFPPMKGPLTTQSLRGMANHGPMHWRGDRTGSLTEPNTQPDSGAFNEQEAFRQFQKGFTDLLRASSAAFGRGHDSVHRFHSAGDVPAQPHPKSRQLAHSRPASEARLLFQPDQRAGRGRVPVLSPARPRGQLPSSAWPNLLFGTEGMEAREVFPRRSNSAPPKPLYQGRMFGMLNLDPLDRVDSESAGFHRRPDSRFRHVTCG